MKTCSKCGVTFPATAEFFHRDRSKPDGLATRCKTCSNQRPAGRRCVVCRRELSPRNYRREDWDNVDRVCYQCREPDAKYCSGCRTWLPKEAFDNCSRRSDGLQGWCKVCHRDRARHLAPRVRQLNRIRYRRNSTYEKRAAKWARRRSRKLRADGHWTDADLNIIRRGQNNRCWWCGKELVDGDIHVDHRIPLARGGSNSVGNLCLTCSTCNQSKGTKLPHEWNGRLL